MGTPVNFFVVDKAFVDQRTPFQSLLEAPGGIAQLSQKGLSYFMDLEIFNDLRNVSSRQIDWTAVFGAAILIDGHYYSAFSTALSAAPVATRNSIFAIIDRLFFNSSNGNSMETFLTTDPVASVAYVPKSLSLSTTRVNGQYYPSTVGSPSVSYSCNAFASISVTIPTGGTSVVYDLSVYVDNATWIAEYPNTTVTGVAPPIDYPTLLNTPLATATANMFTTAASVAKLNYTSLTQAVGTEPASGYLVYEVQVHDADGTIVIAPFNVLYKGSIPNQLQIRAAVREAVLASGVGTQAQWKVRIPDLFVNTRYYLIPLWENKTELSDQVLFTGINNLQNSLNVAQKILPSMDSSVVVATVEAFEVAYNKMTLLSVPDISALNEYISLMSVYPTYQSYTPTSADSNYKYMSPDAQAWSTILNQLLAVASGAQASDTWTTTTDRGLTYYSFTQNSTEFCLVTPDSYNQMIGSTS